MLLCGTATLIVDVFEEIKAPHFFHPLIAINKTRSENVGNAQCHDNSPRITTFAEKISSFGEVRKNT